MRVLVFGDSIAWGGYDPDGGWVDAIKRRFIVKDGRSGAKIINLGIGGDTSEFLKARIEPNIASARISTKEIAVIFSVGCNDSRIVNATGKAELSEEEFEKNLDECFGIFEKYTKRVLVVGLHTLGPDKASTLDKDYTYSVEMIARYNEMLKKVAERRGLPFVNVAHLVEGKPEMFYEDDLHLSTKGHEVLAAAIYPAVEKMLGK